MKLIIIPLLSLALSHSFIEAHRWPQNPRHIAEGQATAHLLRQIEAEPEYQEQEMVELADE